jgi:hypothetical protein
MLAQNILAVFAFAAAAIASPLEVRNPQSCSQNQQLNCCQEIFAGVGIGCIPVVNVLDCNQFAGCCNQQGSGGLLGVSFAFFPLPCLQSAPLTICPSFFGTDYYGTRTSASPSKRRAHISRHLCPAATENRRIHGFRGGWKWCFQGLFIGIMIDERAGRSF